MNRPFKLSAGILLTVVMIFTSCASSTSQKAHKGNPSSKFQDDLTSYRPRPFKTEEDTVKTTEVNTEVVKPQNDITAKLDARLDSIAELNKKTTTTQGFRILVYSGNSSEEASKTKVKVYDLLPDVNVYSIYKQPSFRVKVGDYPQRLQAYNALSLLRDAFPNAMIVPDEINIVK
ncbi:MAG TPA: SPOR domain-containing protein [Cytophagaceae bacterium]